MTRAESTRPALHISSSAATELMSEICSARNESRKIVKFAIHGREKSYWMMSLYKGSELFVFRIGGQITHLLFSCGHVNPERYL